VMAARITDHVWTTRTSDRMRIVNEAEGYIDYYYSRPDGSLWGVRIRRRSCHATECATGKFEDMQPYEREHNLPVLTDPKRPDWFPRVLLARAEYMARYPESDLASLMDQQKDFDVALHQQSPH
jgi:hypothetical protein